MVSRRRGPRPDAAREDEGSGNAGAARGRARKLPERLGPDPAGPGQGAGRRGGVHAGDTGAHGRRVCVCVGGLVGGQGGGS